MANLIEIRVTATNDTGAGLDTAKADAAAAGAEAGAAFNDSYASAVGAGSVQAMAVSDLGDSAVKAVQDAQVGTKMAAEMDRQLADADVMSALADEGSKAVAQWQAHQFTWDDLIAGLDKSAPLVEQESERTGASSGAAFTQAFQMEAGRALSDTSALGSGFDGGPAGDGFAVKFSSAAKGGIEQANIAGILGDSSAFADDVEQEAEAAGTRAGTSLGVATKTSATKAAADAGEGMSNLIIAGLATAAVVGPAALLTGVGAAVVGVGALVEKSNQQVADDATALAGTLQSTLAAAAMPLTGSLESAMEILQQGVVQNGAGLTQMFAAAEPYADAIAQSVDSLASDALPGVATGLRDLQPVLSGLAVDAGDIGSGLGGFVSALGSGASGSASALTAISSAAKELLPDLGQIIGDLDNGLGPALGDIVAVADPVAHDLTAVVGAIPPGAIRTAADAVTALFVAFKVGSMTGLIADGTKFTSWASSILPAAASQAKSALASIATGADEAAASETTLAASSVAAGEATEGAAASMSSAAGPIGLVVTGAAMLGEKLGQISGVGPGVISNMQGITSAIAETSGGSQALGGDLDQLGQRFGAMQAMTHDVPSNFSDIDQALAQLQQTDPQQAAKDFQSLASGMEKSGLSASTVASDLPQYTSAVDQAKAAALAAVPSTQQWADSLDTAHAAMITAAQTAGVTAVAALGLGTSQTGLNQQLAAGVTQYQELSSAAGGYQTILNSLNGSTMSADQAQNTLAQDMLTAKTSFKQNGESLDLNTQAGINNRQSLTQAAQAITALGVANIQSGGNINSANAIIQQQITAFVNATGATGKQREAILQYIESLTQIPPSESTDIDANTAPATAAVKALLQMVDSSHGTIGVSITQSPGSRQTSQYGYATGGVVSTAAVGGSRSGMTQIDEQGAELVNLPNGSTVTPASNVQSLAAAGLFGGSGSGPIQLEWVGGPADDLGRTLFRWIQGQIRAIGGGGPDSVQRALGQVF